MVNRRATRFVVDRSGYPGFAPGRMVHIRNVDRPRYAGVIHSNFSWLMKISSGTALVLTPEKYSEGKMTNKRFTVPFVFLLLGCSVNPSLDNLRALNGGAIIDFNIAQFDKASAPRSSSIADHLIVNQGIGKYEFSVEEAIFRESAFLANGKEAPSLKLVAKNRGYAPVSVTITYDRGLSENMTCDVASPHTSVVPPRSEMVVARVDPINIGTKWQFFWDYTWNIGDYTARHVCPERYRYPYPDTVTAHAAASEEPGSTPYTRNAVMFSLPADAGVLAARNGTVVRIGENNDLDILHDDSTIATYSHLGEIAQSIRVGKAVKAGEPVGTAGKSEGRASLQLAVWRPEHDAAAAALDPAGRHVFQAVSYPLEFRADSGNGKVVKQGRPLASTAAVPAAAKKSTAGIESVDYDFSLTDDHATEAALMFDRTPAARIIAVNRGYAPVTVTFDLDPEMTENIKTDVSLPHTAVIHPQSEMVLARLSPKDARKGMRYGCEYAWQLGDYTSRHQCPERYRFPFATNVRAIARVPDPRISDPFARYSVQFSLPVESQIVAARNGIVVRVKENNDLDVLHNDSTIATYKHLGKVAEGVSAGKLVTAGDLLGVAGRSGKSGEAFIQLTVWRPEQLPADAPAKKGAASNIHTASFPLEFCSDAHDCRVLTHNQQVSVKPIRKKK